MLGCILLNVHNIVHTIQRLSFVSFIIAIIQVLRQIILVHFFLLTHECIFPISTFWATFFLFQILTLNSRFLLASILIIDYWMALEWCYWKNSSYHLLEIWLDLHFLTHFFNCFLGCIDLCLDFAMHRFWENNCLLLAIW